MDYDGAFFDQITQGSLSSARIILPILFRYYKPASIIDVGCGRGAWLKAAEECGVSDVLGIDGAYVDRGALLIDDRRFQAVDLAETVGIDRKFDLVISLEVAEHLPLSRSETFVADLVGLADVVLFSAALPYQSGTHHINEQWLEFWAIHFRRYGYVPCDLFRRQIWGNTSVESWYRQNAIVFCKEALASKLFPLQTLASGKPLSFVHPLTFLTNLQFYRPLLAQASALELEDYARVLAAYLSGQTTVPSLSLWEATAQVNGGKIDLFPSARTEIMSAPEEMAFREQIGRLERELRVRQQTIQSLSGRLQEKEETLSRVVNSKGWRLLNRLRSMKRQFQFLERKTDDVRDVAAPGAAPTQTEHIAFAGSGGVAVERDSSSPSPVRASGKSIDASIVILARNEAHNLRRSLPLIAGQKTAVRFEIIGIDTASEDQTAELFKLHGARTFTIRREDFHHFRTRLFAAEEARGPIVVFLVGDGQPANEHWLQNLLQPLLEEDLVAAAYSRQLPAAGCVPWEARDILRGGSVVREVKQVDWSNPVAVENYRQNIWKYISFSDVSSCYRRDLLRALPMHEQMSEIEDQYWCKCLLERGYRIVLEPNSVVIHSHNDSLERLYHRQLTYGRCFAAFTDAQPEPLRRSIAYSLEDSVADLFFLLTSAERGFLRKVVQALQIPPMRLTKRLGFREGLRQGILDRQAALTRSRGSAERSKLV